PCFCHASGTPRSLHAFPTRRSSDLVCGQRPNEGTAAPEAPGTAVEPDGWKEPKDMTTIIQRRARDVHAGDVIIRDPGVHVACTRSEEHTSELQSRENLVCRLLLEKK